jgi:hypothetical protein
MPVTLSPAGGDGVINPAWAANVQLPDTGLAITINGSYQPPSLSANPGGQQAITNFTGSVNSPGVPGSNNNYLLVEVNISTGALTAKTSPTAMPAVDSGNVILFTQVIPSTAPSAISQQGGITIPWL